MISLLALLTVTALAAAACKLLSLDAWSTLLFESFVVFFWWKIAERRQNVEPKASVDQAELRAEVAEWLLEREQNV